jgi:ketosteroid isomerase-like protein
MNPNSKKLTQKPLTLLFSFLILMIFAVPAFAKNDARSTVEAREIAFAKTMADRDFEAFQTFLSSEAIFFSRDGALRGKDAIKAEWIRYYDAEEAPFSWHPDTVEVLDSGHLAISSGPVISPEGEEIGRFNSIWRKEDDGEWRVIFDKGS